MTVALDQLSQVRAPRSPRTTVLPDPTVLAPLARTRSGARSSSRPEGTWGRAYRWGIAGGDLLLTTAAVATMLWSAFPVVTALVAAVAGGLVFTLLTGFMHGYDFRRAASGTHDYKVILRAGWIWASLLLAVLYFGVIALADPSAFAAILGGLCLRSEE